MFRCRRSLASADDGGRPTAWSRHRLAQSGTSLTTLALAPRLWWGYSSSLTIATVRPAVRPGCHGMGPEMVTVGGGPRWVHRPEAGCSRRARPTMSRVTGTLLASARRTPDASRLGDEHRGSS